MGIYGDYVGCDPNKRAFFPDEKGTPVHHPAQKNNMSPRPSFGVPSASPEAAPLRDQSFFTAVTRE